MWRLKHLAIYIKLEDVWEVLRSFGLTANNVVQCWHEKGGQRAWCYILDLWLTYTKKKKQRLKINRRLYASTKGIRWPRNTISSSEKILGQIRNRLYMVDRVLWLFHSRLWECQKRLGDWSAMLGSHHWRERMRQMHEAIFLPNDRKDKRVNWKVDEIIFHFLWH